MKLTTIFILCVLCLSCSDDHKNTKSNIELLQGDWTTEKYPREHFGLHHFHINVKDSIFTMFSNYSDSTRFKIQGKLLTVLDSSNTYYFGTHQKYQIVKLTNDELTLIAKSNYVKKHLRAYHWYSDTLKFHKIFKKNNLSPNKIQFSASGCYGSCPMLKISIDKQLNVKFYGHMYTTKEGPYSGKITQGEYDLIVKQINQLTLNSLKTAYEATWTDDQTRSIVIETSDTIIKTYAYGTYLEPIELTLLFDNLVDVYKRASLKKDDLVDSQKTFDEYLKVFLPILITPQPIE